MKTKPTVLFVFGRERQERLGRYERGEGPDDFLYGMNHFASDQFTTKFVAKNDQQWTIYRILWEPIDRVISLWFQMGFALHTILYERRALRTADIIVSTADTMGLPIALTKKLGWLPASQPLIYLSQGLTDRLQRFPAQSFTRRFFIAAYGPLLAQANRIVVLGEGAVAPLQTLFPKRSLLITALPFGVDSQFWSPTVTSSATTEKYVLTVGSDKGRDYPTLLKAIGDQPLKVVTGQRLPAALLKPTISVGTNYSDVELRELYRQSLFVVIPLQDVAQPSGQSATLQAMACGKAVILTQTKGLWEPKYMQHLVNCYLVPPGDVEALEVAIDYLKTNPEVAQKLGEAARQTVSDRYSSLQFGQRLQELCAQANQQF